MKIAVLLSGGVDSSMALKRLIDEGHDLTAFYLKIWLEDELSYLGECPWEEDLEVVQAVCAQMNVPLEVVSLQKEYWDHVVSYTIAEVKAGRTPNPDILCNEQIKFGLFYKKIDPSFEKIATGHYARVEQRENIFYLKKSPDPIKDQTYFLSRLSQEQLSRALFPIGAYEKGEVRQLAKQFNLPNKDRKDSQGICFLGQIKFSEFIKHHLGEQIGDLIEFETGKKIGEHLGFWYYTIGQRQGLGLSGGPWFVVKKDIENNRVYISKDYHAEDKVRDEFNVRDLHWISGYKPRLGAAVQLDVKIRHGEKIYSSKVKFNEEKGATIKLSQSDQGIAPGQFAVFYEGEYCLGNGIID